MALEHYHHAIPKHSGDCTSCGCCDGRCPFQVKRSARMGEIGSVSDIYAGGERKMFSIEELRKQEERYQFTVFNHQCAFDLAMMILENTGCGRQDGNSRKVWASASSRADWWYSRI